jgi:hypothetical protein
MQSADSGRSVPDSLIGEHYLSKREQKENALWRIKHAADERRQDRMDRILSQEGESLAKTLGRVVYVSACILFDGLVLTEIIVRLDRTAFAWFVFAVVLGFAIVVQRNLYDEWFADDISQIE